MLTTYFLSLLAPSMGLIKTANAVLKRIQTSLKENGHPYEFEFVQDMDNILSHCQKISPLVSKQTSVQSYIYQVL